MPGNCRRLASSGAGLRKACHLAAWFFIEFMMEVFALLRCFFKEYLFNLYGLNPTMGWIENDWAGDYLLIFDWNFGGFTGGPSSNFSIKVVQFLGDEPWCFRGLTELGLLQVWHDLWESSHDCGWVMWMIEWSEPLFQSLPNHWCFRFLQIHREILKHNSGGIWIRWFAQVPQKMSSMCLFCAQHYRGGVLNFIRK